MELFIKGNHIFQLTRAWAFDINIRRFLKALNKNITHKPIPKIQMISIFYIFDTSILKNYRFCYILLQVIICSKLIVTGESIFR